VVIYSSGIHPPKKTVVTPWAGVMRDGRMLTTTREIAKTEPHEVAYQKVGSALENAGLGHLAKKMQGTPGSIETPGASSTIQDRSFIHIPVSGESEAAEVAKAVGPLIDHDHWSKNAHWTNSPSPVHYEREGYGPVGYGIKKNVWQWYKKEL
jgi:hypothetical protein